MTTSSTTPMTDSADNKAMEDVMAQQVADASSNNSIVALEDGSSQTENTSTLTPNDPTNKTPVHASANSVKEKTQYQDKKVSTTVETNEGKYQNCSQMLLDVEFSV